MTKTVRQKCSTWAPGRKLSNIRAPQGDPSEAAIDKHGSRSHRRCVLTWPDPVRVRAHDQ